MKSQLRTIAMTCALSCALAGFATAQGRRGPRPAPAPVPAGVYTTVSGTIAQFNYNRDADIEGFLLNNNTLVHLPPRAAPEVTPALHKGDTVQVAGSSQATPSGFQAIEAQDIKDRTSGKAFTVSEPGPPAPYSGSGHIQQLNYGPDGAINGFVLDNGTLAAVPPFSATNPSSVRVGAAISFTGYARTTMSGRTVVDVQNLSINGQTLAVVEGGPGRGPDGPPPPPAAGPEERTDEPPPPPPPPAAAPQL